MEKNRSLLKMDTVLDGRYRVVKVIGEGGMGIVYEARHVVLDKRFAVKVMYGDRTTKAENRFLQEAKMASSIGHENIIDITDFGRTEQGHLYFVMEYLDGQELSDIIVKEAPLPWPRVRSIAIQVAQALEACHHRNIIDSL